MNYEAKEDENDGVSPLVTLPDSRSVFSRKQDTFCSYITRKKSERFDVFFFLTRCAFFFSTLLVSAIKLAAAFLDAPIGS